MTNHDTPVCFHWKRRIWIKQRCNLHFTDKIPLKSSLTYSDKFEAGHDDEFVLEVVNIGELEKIV